MGFFSKNAGLLILTNRSMPFTQWVDKNTNKDKLTQFDMILKSRNDLQTDQESKRSETTFSNIYLSSALPLVLLPLRSILSVAYFTTKSKRV